MNSASISIRRRSFPPGWIFWKTTRSKGIAFLPCAYADWRKVDGVMLPFSLRYELNGQPLQEEQIKSAKHNVALVAETFAVPAAIRNEQPDAKPIASQWLLRQVGPNLSHQDVGRNPPVEVVRLAQGVRHQLGPR